MPVCSSSSIINHQQIRLVVLSPVCPHIVTLVLSVPVPTLTLITSAQARDLDQQHILQKEDWTLGGF